MSSDAHRWVEGKSCKHSAAADAGKKPKGKSNSLQPQELKMAHYGPLAVETMGTAFDEAWRCMPLEQRTDEPGASMAVRLLNAAELGERDPKKLKDAALGFPVSFVFLDFIAALAKE